jgi:hypothetical protein
MSASVEIHPSVAIHSEEVLMPRIIVTAENGSERPVLLDERVEPVHLDDTHHSVELLERIAWALADAEKAETRFTAVLS